MYWFYSNKGGFGLQIIEVSLKNIVLYNFVEDWIELNSLECSILSNSVMLINDIYINFVILLCQLMILDFDNLYYYLCYSKFNSVIIFPSVLRISNLLSDSKRHKEKKNYR